MRQLVSRSGGGLPGGPTHHRFGGVGLTAVLAPVAIVAHATPLFAGPTRGAVPYRKEVEALNAQIKEMRSAAGLSLNANVNARFEGDVKAKQLQLKVHQGGSEKNYTFQLERYELVDKERNISPIARWIITDIKEQVLS